MAIASVVTFYLESIREAWEFVLESGAGIGLVLMLRWYWWRGNAWSEITAMIAPALGFLYLRLFTTIAFPYTLLYLVAWTTVCWLFVTMITAPELEAHLVAFYRRVRPGGPGWRADLRLNRLAGSSSTGWRAVVSSTRCCSGSARRFSASIAWPSCACGCRGSDRRYLARPVRATMEDCMSRQSISHQSSVAVASHQPQSRLVSHRSRS
jgi:hypothetical protein